MMIHRLLCLALFVASFFCRVPASAQDPQIFAGGDPADAASPKPEQASPLEALIEPLVIAHQGDAAVSIRHLVTGEAYQINGDRPQATASLIKLPVMVELYKQAVDNKTALYKQLDLRNDDMVPGSGILTTHFSPGMRFSIRDAVRLMISVSDNTATNMIVDKISIEAINAHMAKLGYTETRLHSKVYRRDTSVDPHRSERYGLGSTTANDMVDLLARIHAGTVVSPTACKDMLEHLAACEDKQKFPALLPDNTKIFHKTGSVDKVRTDAGIIETSSGPYVLCVLTENNADTRWSPDNAGDRLCAQIAKASFDYFEGKADSQATPKVDNTNMPMAMGASGEMVEALQRTLNAQAEITSKLSVDGDFGPATEIAVKQFQAAKGLDASGQVTEETWKALGPLRLEDEPVEEPQVVNSQQLEKSPADDPFGIPAVTCKAWTVADANSGQVLWGHDNDKSLDIASTTKIMTAYLVMQYCQSQPAALDEVLTFSQRADSTIGSTAAVRTGEKIRVGDLLYGLMLPSGNDASVALAEHFGARVLDYVQASPLPGTPATVTASALITTPIVDPLVVDDHLPPPVVNPEAQFETEPTPIAVEPPTIKQVSKEESYEAFIKAMNLMAEQLGMTNTRLVNPHGLTSEEHKSSCNDLVRLTLAARQLPLFRQVTSTRQYGCKVTGSNGYVRNIKWENTNQLLPIEGYLGVKTGTTDAAGACLVSVGAYRDRELIVVVLGSAASAARYTDTRNLFAWSWRELFK